LKAAAAKISITTVLIILMVLMKDKYRNSKIVLILLRAICFVGLFFNIYFYNQKIDEAL